MKKERKNQMNSWLDNDKKRLLQVLTVPLVVFILILIIRFADRPVKVVDSNGESTGEVLTEPALPEQSEADEEQPEPGEELSDPGEEPSSTEESTEEVTESATKDVYATDTFLRDSVPEIVDLMKAYFQARATADIEGMNQLYGITDMAVTKLEEKRTSMRINAKYITDFRNITTYVRDGVAADSWLVYAVADMKFRSVETTAPMVMYCYVTRDEEGNYMIADTKTLTSQVRSYIDEANRTEEVRRLSGDVGRRLREALEADADLKAIYGILQANSPVWGEEYRESTAEVRIIFGEEEESTADSSEAAETPASESTAQ